MSEETRVIRRVGSYSTSQAHVEDCKKCKNAKMATVLIDSVCLDCYVENEKKDLKHFKDTVIGLWATDKPDLLSKEEKEKYHLFEIV